MSEITDQQVFQIPAENMPGLMHKLERLSKKSVKLIDRPITLQVIKEVRKPLLVRDAYGRKQQATDDDGNLCWDIFYDVTIDAETPKINGWSFIATIDHLDGGNVIRTSPNANCEVPEQYRTAQPFCDHCNKVRTRKDTFLLRSDATGEFKQIGRQCIRDFIGYDVTQVVAMAEIIGSASPSDSDSDYGGPVNHSYIRVPTYLAHVAAVVRKAGWVGSKEAANGLGQRTASHALTNMFPPPLGSKNSYERIPLTDKDFETAEAAMAWAQALGEQKNVREFDNNMCVLANQDTVEYRSTGILAYIVPAFFKATQREFERVQRRAALKLAESEHIGTVGDKIGTKKTHTIAPFEAILYGYYTKPGQFGTTYTYRFRSDEGNVIIWRASEGPAEALGLGGIDASKRARVRFNGGTVRDHSEYQNVKQTVLTRCKVEVLKECTGL